MAFSVEYSENARRELRRYPRRLRAQIMTAVSALASDPHPPDSDVLWGDWTGHRRLRMAAMERVIYRVDHRERHIEIVAIGPRSRIYA